MVAFAKAGKRVPVVFFIDDVCSTRLTLMKEAGFIAQGGERMRQELPWTVLLMCAQDWQCDEFHGPNHVETVCRKRFDPKAREHPPATNSEVGEQTWAAANRQVSSVKYMGRARFRFMLMSAFALWNMWTAKTPYDRRSARKLQLKPPGDKHARRGKEVRAAKGAAPGGVAAKKPAARATTKNMRRGRMPIVDAMSEFPQGFDTRLLEVLPGGERRRYADVDPRWFRDNEAFLIGEVKKIMPPFGEPTHNAKWKCMNMLHRTLVDWVVQGGPPAHLGGAMDEG